VVQKASAFSILLGRFIIDYFSFLTIFGKWKIFLSFPFFLQTAYFLFCELKKPYIGRVE